MEEEIKKIEELRLKLLQSSPQAVEAQHKAGKLTARERVEKLVDSGTFFEIEMFSKPIATGFAIDKQTTRGDGLISGYGEVTGRPVCIWAQDATVLKGRFGFTHLAKMVTLMERALKARIPCIGLIDSEGIRVEDMISTPTNYSYDKLIHVQTTASGIIPQISLIMGPCIGTAAISAQLSDFVFMVRNTSYSCALASPEGVGLDEIGGAAMHYKDSGCCDVLADNDEACIEKARDLLSYLPLNNCEKPSEVDTGDSPNREVPELCEIVPVKGMKPYNVKDVINVIVDKGHFFEIKAGWAMNLVVGFARFGGKSVGIVANNPQIKGGCLDVDSADKLARFVRFCDAFNIPLIYLADTPAFLPSIEQEQRGIIRHGAKVVFSNSEATTPQIQIYLRKCYGGGGLAMPGTNLNGDFGLAWPTAEILLMYPEGAVAIIDRKEIASAENPKEEFNKRLAEFKSAGAVENVWEDHTVQDFINPKDTRSMIVKTLKMLERKREVSYWKKHDNMPL